MLSTAYCQSLCRHGKNQIEFDDTLYRISMKIQAKQHTVIIITDRMTHDNNREHTVISGQLLWCDRISDGHLEGFYGLVGQSTTSVCSF